MKKEIKSSSFLAFIFLSSSLFACSTSYQEKNIFGFGYSDKDEGGEKKRISFNGSFASDTSDLKTFVYQRAADYCRENKMDSYELIDEIIVGSERTKKDEDYVISNKLSAPYISIVIRCLGFEEEDEEDG